VVDPSVVVVPFVVAVPFVVTVSWTVVVVVFGIYSQDSMYLSLY
jgi:hypothetical protein